MAVHMLDVMRLISRNWATTIPGGFQAEIKFKENCWQVASSKGVFALYCYSYIRVVCTYITQYEISLEFIDIRNSPGDTAFHLQRILQEGG